MSFNTSPGRAEYTAGAGQTAFPFSFKIYADTDIKVYQTLAGQVPDDTSDILMLTTHYTVTINGDLGGEVTLVSGAAINDSLTIVRDLPIERPTEYQNNGDLLAATLNQDQDYQTYLIADKDSANLRFISIPESAQGVSTTLPNPAPLNFVQWNPTGTGFQNVSSLQADGYIWTAADVYNKTEADALLALKADQATIDTAVADRRKLYAAETTTHDFASDADYTLTAAQNLYGRIVLTDTTPFLTVARNVITDNIEKSFIVQNDTLQTITVKTLAGAGISILPGAFGFLYNNGINILSLDIASKSLSTNGYIKLPSGLIMQWGTTPSLATNSSQVVSFPIVFPSACLAVQLTVSGALATNESIGCSAVFNAANFTQYHYSGTSVSRVYTYLAIGY